MNLTIRYRSGEMRYNAAMRLLPLILIALAGSLVAGEATSTYPLWDGQVSVADYAKRVNLPPTKTLDLGGGVKMELMLIPAGRFMMGTPEPEEPKETVQAGQAILGIARWKLFDILVMVM